MARWEAMGQQVTNDWYHWSQMELQYLAAEHKSTTYFNSFGVGLSMGTEPAASSTALKENPPG